MRVKILPMAVAATLVTIVLAAVLLLMLAPHPQTVTLTGRLKQGVESRCITLEADNGQTYNLIDLPAMFCGDIFCQPPFDHRVSVTGHVVTDTATTCMQGIPFHVEKMTVLA